MTSPNGGGGNSTARLVAVLAALTASVGLVLAGGGSAYASDPFANYVTAVTRIQPALTGVSAKAAPDGAYIVVRNTSATPLVVDGYQHEPYLGISSAGVWQNQRSPAVYLNKEQFIDSIPRSADATAKPQWKKIASGSSMRWHDHRIHWMGALQPPVVAHEPGRPHLIKTWTIPVRYDGRAGEIRGTLRWEPGSQVTRYLTWGLPVVTVVAVLGSAVVIRRRRSAPSVS